MNKKNILIIGIVAIVSLLIGGGVYYSLTKEDKISTLNLLEKQWIERNKNNIVDLSIPSDIPIFDYEGKGVMFDFISDLEKDTGLEFNKVSYDLNSSPNTSYYYGVSKKLDDSSILLYEDHYVLLTKKNITYSRLSDISSLTIGVLNNEMDEINRYMSGADVTYKSYDSVDKLFEDIKNDESEIKAIAVPRTIYLDKILGENKLNIAYHITDMKSYFTLHLGDDSKLNTIIKKYFNKWNSQNFEDSFNSNFSTCYFTFNGINEKEKSKIKSKKYYYAFVENRPFDTLASGELTGINNEILSSFSSIADIEINSKSYNSIESLISDFNKNRIDLFLGNTAVNKFDMDVNTTPSYIPMDVAIISNRDNNITINSVSSLNGIEVFTIKTSKIAAYLERNGVKVKTYDNIDSLLNNINNDSILALDYENYQYYSRNKLSSFKVDFIDYTSDSYGFVVRDIKDNSVFYDFFAFYLSFENSKSFINNGLSHVSLNVNSNMTIRYMLLILIVVVLVILGFMAFKYFKKIKDNSPSYTKESKLKYIDMLTSLKNRNYLNDHVESWDNSEVYPQTIIIVDLNNIAYINDNYGHQEGDNVIKEAANILIKTQIKNRDIIRTDGNEFLIYLVGQDEKEIIAYIKKLTKEMKELAHGFGAAIGYSIINDGIKTIDDAVNEATLAMKDNKEEI